jgi:hypothetical protein
MFIESETEFCAPSLTMKLREYVVVINEYGGVPAKLLPVYVNQLGFPVIAIVIA